MSDVLTQLTQSIGGASCGPRNNAKDPLNEKETLQASPNEMKKCSVANNLQTQEESGQTLNIKTAESASSSKSDSKPVPPPLPTSKPKVATGNGSVIPPPQPIHKLQASKPPTKPDSDCKFPKASGMVTGPRGINPHCVASRPHLSNMGALNPSCSPIRPQGPPALPQRSCNGQTAPPIPTRDSTYANLGEWRLVVRMSARYLFQLHLAIV